MKYILYIFTGLVISHGQIDASESAYSNKSGNIDAIRTPAATEQYLDRNSEISINSEKALEPPFVIHYGPNDSHSRSWVRENGDGVVGIACFQLTDGSPDEGTLIYRTILPDGSENTEPVATGRRMEKAVLLYDSLLSPHIFVARSNDSDQLIEQYSKSIDIWQCDTIIHFYNEGGKFIYELSAETGPDHSFHLLILKSRSDVDSDDFMDAWINSYLYHMTNKTGSWEKELVHNYDMAYTYDMYIKSSIRQDMKIDQDGYVHVTFSEQLNGSYDPSRLWYATNKTGTWVREIALKNDYGLVDDAGWFPSLCLDNNGTPYISCIYVNRVLTYSALYCKLFLLKRLGDNNWDCEVIAEYDDGYYGGDGRDYTGALTHLVFDKNNTPHIIFSDIASTHWPILNQRLNVGNIRYGVFEDNAWDFTTIYRQPLPTGFFSAIEMLGMCLIISDLTDTIRIIGQELEVTGENQYTSHLLDFAWAANPTDIEDDPDNSLPGGLRVFQNHPNPFNPGTSIKFDLPRQSRVTIRVYNLLGQEVCLLLADELPAGNHSVYWDGTDNRGTTVSSGIYFYSFQSGDHVESKKMLLLK